MLGALLLALDRAPNIGVLAPLGLFDIEMKELRSPRAEAYLQCFSIAVD
jgi:hypothetical protein